ncbi:MAG: cob(I)yrinic acid a,c-diamide adenosyltransferase [Patescibacteria group bacterium]
MIQIYTGDGKGKTTAALGLVIRAVGAGKKVAWVAFDKGGSHYAERVVFTQRFPEMDFNATGLDRMNLETGTFRFGVTDDDRLEGERGLGIVRKLFQDAKQDLIVLDEINISTSLGIVSEADVLALLKQKPPQTELVLTGRNAPASFIELADLVTEMRMNKHYIQQGVKARYGLDY